jgi:ribosomal protein S18 acetylase RimI-like enzyme
MGFCKTSVRPATVEDAFAIGQVHAESSRGTYQGIFPEAWLSRFSVEERARRWKERLTAPDPRDVSLAGCDESGRIVGFLSGGAERTGQLGCEGELYAIYLLPAAQRQGLGRLLVKRLVAALRPMGINSMAVWVLARNPAVRFYEGLGGKRIAERQHERAGEWFEEIAYGWSDLARFPE